MSTISRYKKIREEVGISNRTRKAALAFAKSNTPKDVADAVKKHEKEAKIKKNAERRATKVLYKKDDPSGIVKKAREVIKSNGFQASTHSKSANIKRLAGKVVHEQVQYLDEVKRFVSQLRKVMDTEGQHVVDFEDGSKYKVNTDHALRALSLHDQLINAEQRNHYIKRISKSKQDFRKAMAGKKF